MNKLDAYYSRLLAQDRAKRAEINETARKSAHIKSDTDWIDDDLREIAEKHFKDIEAEKAFENIFVGDDSKYKAREYNPFEDIMSVAIQPQKNENLNTEKNKYIENEFDNIFA